MSILRRSFIYIFRKKSRTVLIFMILFLISTAILSSITIRKSAHNARESINASINASFELKTNLQTNMGVGDRGFGNISQMMIEKISKHEKIRDFNASIFGEAQLPQLKKVQLEESRIKYQDDQEALLKSHFDLEGTRKSELDSKFVSEVLELHEGRHLNEDDFQKVMVHHDFATLNGLKLHDIITIPESKDRNQNIIKSQKLEI
ncbi:ABC transporter permease, partial [Erysipelothrix rhusiopathiae]|nr:ABC transporter permease [Erysipelothrix rhusiopathiae]